MKREWIRLVCLVSVEARYDVIFVRLAGLKFWNEGFPNSGLPEGLHGMALDIPAIEGAYDRNAFRIWCPDGEVHAIDAIHGMAMSAKMPVKADVAAFVEEIEIVLCQ